MMGFQKAGLHSIIANAVHFRSTWDAKRVVNLMNKVEHSSRGMAESGLRGDWMPAGGLILHAVDEK